MDLHVAHALPAADALRFGPEFVARAYTDAASPAAVFAAELTGSAIALGRFQRGGVAASSAADVIVRRRTGGRAVHAGAGVTYLALGLRDASVFLPCPRDRVLNRNVRGMLVGLSTSGVAAHYFGRDFVSIDRRPAVSATWSRNAQGNVLLEFFVGVQRPYNVDAEALTYPAHRSDPLLGKVPTTLEAAWKRTVAFDEVVDRVVRQGYAKTYGLTLDEPPFSHQAALEPAQASDEDGFTWSGPREVPIGFIDAGIRRAANGQIEAVRLAGDYFGDDDGERMLNDAMRGTEGSDVELVAAINHAYGKEGAVIDGIASLNAIRDAFLAIATPT